MFIFFNDTATTEIYTLSLHDALPIYERYILEAYGAGAIAELDRLRLSLGKATDEELGEMFQQDRKSTRLNSSHANISYAVFCLKKKILEHPNAQPLVPPPASVLCSLY